MASVIDSGSKSRVRKSADRPSSFLLSFSPNPLKIETADRPFFPNDNNVEYTIGRAEDLHLLFCFLDYDFVSLTKTISHVSSRRNRFGFSKRIYIYIFIYIYIYSCLSKNL